MGNKLLLGKGYRRSASGDAALTTAFLARTVTGGAVSAVLNGTHLAAVKAFLNGIVSDGIDANFDAIYIIAAQSIGADNMDIARLNMVQNAFNLTGTGMTFAADRGATDNGVSGVFSTGFIPSSASGKYTANDAMLGVWGNGTGGTGFDVGYGGGVGGISCVGGNTTFTEGALNQATTPTFAGATPNGAGFTMVTRENSATTINAYVALPNALSVTTLTSSSTSVTTISGGAIEIGRVPGQNNSGRQISAAWIGKSMVSADVTKFYLRLQSYMTAVGN